MLRQERAEVSHGQLSTAGVPDEGWLRGWVERLAVPRHRVAQATTNRRVAGRVGEAFEALGWRVSEQGVFGNVVAWPREARGKVTLVGAHFDSVPGSPGADDNASGVAAMLALATALARRGARSVGFVAFNAEEDGLLGSRDFVAQGAEWLRAEVAAIHVLEMVGFRRRGPRTQRSPLPWFVPTPTEGDFLGLVGSGESRREVSRVLRSPVGPRRVGLTLWEPVRRLIPDLERSDHAPFWRAGIPAVLWTDTAEFRNPNYHARSDRPDTLDYGFLRQVVEALHGTVSLR